MKLNDIPELQLPAPAAAESSGQATELLARALQRAEWNASMLARTEALCRAGSFELEWPDGRLLMSAGLLRLVGAPPGTPAMTALGSMQWVPEEERAYVAGIWRNAVVGEPFEFQHRVMTAEGSRLVVLHRGQLGEDGRGVALLQDITAQVEAAQRIQSLATHHDVTGLPNRAWLLDQLDAAMHAAGWAGDAGGFAVLALDLPRIAEVKANMGFGAGDTLAMALAARLRGDGAGEVVAAHLAETEFALMIEMVPGITRETVLAQARRLREQLEQPVRLGVTEVHPQCRIGVAFFPGDADAPAALLENAQTARLDLQAGMGVAAFRPDSTHQARRAMQVEAGLWRALQLDEFVLHYQPKVDLVSGQINGAEALLRWNSADLGAVAPGEFIPIAERSGLIGAVGDWVLRQACTDTAAWRRSGLRPVRVSVNLAASQLQRHDLASQVQAVLLDTGADPAWLGVELTESMVMSDVAGATATLRALKAIGVEISLDDFGTGFSSLSSLSRLPIDVVKIDRSFVRDVTADAQDVSVTRAIIHMTHGLQMRVLAEGVETEGQLSLLVAAGCDEMQGYWFSPAVSAAELTALVREGRRLPDRYVRRPSTQRQRTLLLVDDEDNILSALKRLLRRDGYRILTATSAAEGLQRLAETEVDVIVSDQRMPGMTGVEFLHRAKALYPETLRMVLSGYTELQSIIDAVNEGAIYKFLTKPWDDGLLRGHVAEAFRQKEMADENRRLAQRVDTANVDLAKLNEQLGKLLTQQRTEAELLVASANSMRCVFDELPAAVLGLDADGTLSFVNREAERLLPMLSQRLGDSVKHLLPPEALAPLAPDTSARCSAVRLDGRTLSLLFRLLPGPAGPRGRLLLCLPEDEDTFSEP
jgi:diguanylate cyclase (GGDEF)-like protein